MSLNSFFLVNFSLKQHLNNQRLDNIKSLCLYYGSSIMEVPRGDQGELNGEKRKRWTHPPRLGRTPGEGDDVRHQRRGPRTASVGQTDRPTVQLDRGAGREARAAIPEAATGRLGQPT